MTIDRLDIRLLRLPLVRYFETSFARSYDRLFVLVTVHGEGAQGWGEAVAEHDPYYSSETTETVWHVVTEFLAPLVLGRDFAHPRDLWPAMARVRGHNMAKAVVEMAAWDLHAKQNGQPLWQALGGRRRPIASGVSIGIQDSLDELVDRVTIEREAGYQRIKIKIKPGWDIEAVERLRARFGAIPLMVDANAAYTLEDAAHLSALDRFDLMMIEQPLDYDDVMDHARLQRTMRTPVCLDESITSARDAAAAIRLGACRIVNVKPGRVGGYLEARRIHDLCVAHGVPVWCGGMLETGLGRAANVALAALPGFTLPGDTSGSGRYYRTDITPPFLLDDGHLSVPTGPGLGVSPIADELAAVTTRTEWLAV